MNVVRKLEVLDGLSMEEYTSGLDVLKVHSDETNFDEIFVVEDVQMVWLFHLLQICLIQ